MPQAVEQKNTADDNSLVVLNYGNIWTVSVLKLFEQETGIHVKLEEYESPEEMYTKYKAGSIGYDLICTSDLYGRTSDLGGRSK